MSIGPIFCGESVHNLFIDEATACVQNVWPGDETIQIIVYGSNILCMKLVNRNHSCLHSVMGNAMSPSQNMSVCIHSVVCRLHISTNLKNCKFGLCGKMWL